MQKLAILRGVLFWSRNKGLQIQSLDVDVTSQSFYFTLHKCVEMMVLHKFGVRKF